MRLQRLPDSAIPQNPATHFERLASKWSSLQSLMYRTPEQGRRKQAVIDTARALRLRRPSPKTCLEIGCAEGQITERLSPLFEHVTGIDVSPTMIGRAEKLLLPNVTWMVADITEQDLSGTWFDLVILSEVLEHLKEPVALLTRLASVCTYLIATCPITEPLNPEGTFNADLIGHETRQGDASGHIWAMDMEGFKSLIPSGSYDILEARELGPSGLIVAVAK